MKKILTFSLIVFIPFLLLGQKQKPNPRSSKKELVTKTTEYILPSPGIVFKALDNQLKNIKWTDYIEVNKKYSYTENPVIALNLGLRLSNLFLAIQANDNNKLKDLSYPTLALAKDLGVSKPILDMKDTLFFYTDKNDWTGAKGVLEKMTHDIENEANKKPEIGTLAYIGGWLGGLKTVTQVILINYDPKMSEILYQPTLVEYCKKQINKLSTKTKNSTVVKNLIIKVKEIETLIPKRPKQSVTKDKVEQLNKISNELISQIEGA